QFLFQVDATDSGVENTERLTDPTPQKGLPMSELILLSRRDFLRHTAVSTAALGPLTSLPHAATAGDSPVAKWRTQIRIGARISSAWFKSDHDNDLRFLKQIGVDYVDITLDMVKGYAETGCFTKAALQEFLDRLAAVGLRVERANSLGPYY